MADIALGGVERIFKAVMAIKKAVRTVSQNKKECQDIGRCVARVVALLSELHHETDMMMNPAMRGPYDDLADSLEEALELIQRCQGRNALHRYLAAGDMAKQLRRVREDIVLKLMLGNFANGVQITITLERIIRCGGAHPLLTHTRDAGEVVDPCSWQLATDDARSEINSEITMETTASQVPHDPSSRLTEVNLPELEVTMHQISEENNSGRGGHSTVWKQKIVIKISLASERYRSRALALSAATGGVDSVAIAGEDQLVVVGSGVDSIRLVAALRKKLMMTHAYLVEVGEAREAGAVVVNTQEAQPAYEPANVRRRSGIQSMITKLTSKLFMWPHDDIRRISSPSPPSSPPQHVEHTANLPPAESRVPSSYDLAVCKTAPPATEEELELLRDQHDQDSVDALQERVAMLHIDDEDGI